MTIKNDLILLILLCLILFGLIVVGAEGLPVPLLMLRLLLGFLFTLFIPGYTFQGALFPRADDLDGPQRLALSFGLSVAVVPLLALILDNLPWGIRLWPTVVAEGFFIAVCSLVAWCRRWRLPEEERFRLVVKVDMKGWWAVQDRTSRILYGIVAGAILTATMSAIALVMLPEPGESLTEFYILGSEGLAENYPREAVVGQPVAITVGIANHEGVPADYQVFIASDDLLIGQSRPVHLEPGGTGEPLVSFTPVVSGDDVEVVFFLYRDGEGPYRSLRLWLNVTE